MARTILHARRHATPVAELTEREQEVLALVGRGMANKQIARGLGIAPETVKTHVSKIFTKLGAQNRAQAAAMIRRARRPLIVAGGGVHYSRAEEALAAGPSTGGAEALSAWRLKLEGIAREIDAGFARGSLPESLAAVRARIVTALAG